MKTIIAAFRDEGAAVQGLELLRTRSISAENADVLGYSDAGGDVIGALTSRNVPEDRAQRYAEVLRRGASLLVARVPDDQANEIAGDMDQLGSLDLDAAESRWRTSGWNGFDDTASAYTTEESATERSAFDRDFEAAGSDVSEPARDIDVVEEKLQVGKREVSRGGVRVRTFVVEQPVRESVELREERIDVEREPANERIPASAADATFTEDEFTVTARGEEAVVGKEARIVERVHVDKTADVRTEAVEGTERKKEVQVEQIDEDTSHGRLPRH